MRDPGLFLEDLLLLRVPLIVLGEMQAFSGGSAWPHAYPYKGCEKIWVCLEGLLGPMHAPAMAVEVLSFCGESVLQHVCR